MPKRRNELLSATRGVQEFVEKLEKYRTDKVEMLVKKYRQISNLLIKIEEVVVKNSEHKASWPQSRRGALVRRSPMRMRRADGS